MQNQCILAYLKVFPCNFLLNSGESHVVVTSFTHIQRWFAGKFNFLIFNRWKVLKMLKITCFMQNQCISGMPQCITMQFFAQQW